MAEEKKCDCRCFAGPVMVFMLMMTAAAIGMCGGYLAGTVSMHTQAVKRGYAHFVITDKETGRTEWEWK